MSLGAAWSTGWRIPSGPGSHGAAPSRRIPVLVLLGGLALAGCESPDPKAEMELVELETFWAVDPSVGQTSYIAPTARVVFKNKGVKPQRSIQATATFRRKGEEGVTWGSAWAQVAGAAKPLPVGEAAEVVLKSDARYTSPGPPEAMFGNEQFMDAQVEVFVRAGSSGWVKFGEADVDRRIGSRRVEGFQG